MIQRSINANLQMKMESLWSFFNWKAKISYAWHSWDICWKKAAINGFYNHMKKCEGNHDSCELCSYETPRKDVLTKHMEKTHGPKEEKSKTACVQSLPKVFQPTSLDSSKKRRRRYPLSSVQYRIFWPRQS